MKEKENKKQFVTSKIYRFNCFMGTGKVLYGDNDQSKPESLANSVRLMHAMIVVKRKRENEKSKLQKRCYTGESVSLLQIRHRGYLASYAYRYLSVMCWQKKHTCLTGYEYLHDARRNLHKEIDKAN